MEFAWDENKRKANLRNHGIDFVGIEELFEGETVTILDDRFDYGEQRFVTFGTIEGRVVAVAHTETDDTIRVISVRKATRNEETSYYKKIRD
ncbi:MAG: BrnT family toxin [Acidobacteria bacterium]|nr:BrnT family toxin [Acidobacteriota bacterium]